MPTMLEKKFPEVAQKAEELGLGNVYYRGGEWWVGDIQLTYRFVENKPATSLEYITYKYPNVTLKTIPEIGYKELVFDNGDWIIHQHVCNLECHDYRNQCNGEDVLFCNRSKVIITESREEVPEQISGHKDCVTCGNDECESCDDSFSNYF